MNPLKVKRRAANLSTPLLSGKPEQPDRDMNVLAWSVLVGFGRERSALDQN